MTKNRMDWLVDTAWLEEHLNAPDIVVLDGTWHLEDDERDARQDYLTAHIPGALFFDIDEIADASSALPHMLPPPEKFASRMRKMGIGDGMRVVIYDNSDFYSAARVWWMFRVMGATDVAVLDGGMKKWCTESRPVEDGTPTPRSERHFTARQNREMIADRQDVLNAATTRSAQIIDLRSSGRFVGEEPEPREGVRQGHIPGSINLHYQNLMTPDGSLKPLSEIQTMMDGVGVDAQKQIITTCGSGITACILLHALALMGHRRVAVYDGSWAEWGADAELPIEI